MNKLLSKILIVAMNTAFSTDCVTHDNACESGHTQKEMYSHPCMIGIESDNNIKISIDSLHDIRDLRVRVDQLHADDYILHLIRISSAKYIADDKEENKIRTAKICDITLNDQYKVELFTNYGRLYQYPSIYYKNYAEIPWNSIIKDDWGSYAINSDALLKYIQDREQSNNMLENHVEEMGLSAHC